LTSLEKGVESGHMVAPFAETRPGLGSECIHLQRHSIPYVQEILRIGISEQINIPTIDSYFLGQEHNATVNYLLAQIIRQNSLDTTGVLGHLVGFAHDQSDAAFYAASSAQYALDALQVAKGEDAKTQMLSVLFEQAPPTIEDIINLDMTWGATVNGLKQLARPQAANLKRKNLNALMNLAEQRANGKVARLTQREFEGGGNGGHLSDVTEALLLPKVDMPELDAIVPPMLRHGYPELKENQSDLVRFLRRAGILGNDLTRSVIDYIVGREKSASLKSFQESSP